MRWSSHTEGCVVVQGTAAVTKVDRAGLRYAIATITPSGKYWALSTAKLLTDLYVVEGLR